MSKSGLKALGIRNVRLKVKNNDGKTIASVKGLRAWPNVYNILDHSKKDDIHTETTYTFSDSAKASEFEKKFTDNIPNKYKKQFKTELTGRNVKIIWGQNE